MKGKTVNIKTKSKTKMLRAWQVDLQFKTLYENQLCIYIYIPETSLGTEEDRGPIIC